MKTFNEYLEAVKENDNKPIKIKVFQYGKSWSAKFVSGSSKSAALLLGPDAEKNKAFMCATKEALIEKLNKEADKKNIDFTIV